jgi:hypothetical protein
VRKVKEVKMGVLEAFEVLQALGVHFPPGDEALYHLEALETRAQGLGGQHTTLRIRLFCGGEEVGTLLYDSLALPHQLSVLNPSGELVGTIAGAPEELRQILEAVKGLWGGPF